MARTKALITFLVGAVCLALAPSVLTTTSALARPSPQALQAPRAPIRLNLRFTRAQAVRSGSSRH